jgi:hypothetical protein
MCVPRAQAKSSECANLLLAAASRISTPLMSRPFVIRSAAPTRRKEADRAMINPEIKAMQGEARPYMARVRTHRFPGSFRFNTLAEAISYIHQQIGRIGAVGYSGDPKRNAVDDRDSHVEGPNGLRLTVYECSLISEA